MSNSLKISAETAKIAYVILREREFELREIPATEMIGRERKDDESETADSLMRELSSGRSSTIRGVGAESEEAEGGKGSPLLFVPSLFGRLSRELEFEGYEVIGYGEMGR